MKSTIFSLFFSSLLVTLATPIALIPTLAVHAQTFPEETVQQLTDTALKGNLAEGYVDRHDIRIKFIRPLPDDPESFEVAVDHVFRGRSDDHERFWITKRDGQVLSVYQIMQGDFRRYPVIHFPIYLLHKKTPYFSGSPQEWTNYPSLVERNFQQEGKVRFIETENALLSQLSQALPGGK